MTPVSADCQALENRGNWWEDQLAGRCSFPIGPVNTWSNLAYILVGILLLPRAVAGGASLIALGIGSGLYHGFKTVFTDQLDNAGMYLVFGGILVLAVADKQTPVVTLLEFVVGTALAWRLVWFQQPDVVENAVMGCAVGASAMGVGLRGHPWLALAALVLMAVAYLVFWQADQARAPWLKSAGLSRWGHGLWHILTAAGTYLLFRGLT